MVNVQMSQISQENPMRKIKIGKVVVNIAVGKSGEPLDKAARILEELTGNKPCRRNAKQTIKNFGIRKGEPITCMVSLRKINAEKFTDKVMEAKGRTIKRSSFDNIGNVSFGLKEHIEIPGVKYDPELGIYGMNINITLERPGYRIKRRRRCRSDIKPTHKVTPKEAMEFLKEQFSVQIGD
jgi:large subunit ribosomal protein L5